MKNLLLRVVTSLCLLPLVYYIFIKSGQILLFALLVVSFVASYEIIKLMSHEKKSLILASYMVSPFIFLALALIIFNAHYSLFLFLAIAIILLILLFAPKLNKDDFFKVSATLFLMIYVNFALASAYWLRAETTILPGNLGLAFFFIAALCTWANDSFAYLGGRLFGKNPLFLLVSAKKTWEGFVCGALGSIAFIFALRFYIPFFGVDLFSLLSLKDLSFIVFPSLALVPLGDLVESKLKRLFHVKDSSKLLPGHGGILDRIDGLLLIIPYTAIYAFLIRAIW